MERAVPESSVPPPGGSPPITRIFSGMQPTGELHLGNWLGALKTWVELQQQVPCIFSIVDLHALTQGFSAEEMRARIRGVAIDWISAGLDPERATLFVQSTIPEHTELMWVFNTLAPIGALERMTQYKDKAQSQPDNINAGILNYPVLQAADIALYKADGVPVGEDQLQHLELTREIVRKFNNRYGVLFPEPQPLLSPAPRVLGLDGERKMSKSLDNHIALSDSPERVWEKLAPAKTDVRRVRRSDPGVPEDCNIFSYHKFFSSPAQQDWAQSGCRSASIGCRECKQVVSDNINAVLAPMHARRQALTQDPSKVDRVLAAGTESLRPIAREVMCETRDRLGLPTATRYPGGSR